jgi:hypothetical protein
LSAKRLRKNKTQIEQKGTICNLIPLLFIPPTGNRKQPVQKQKAERGQAKYVENNKLDGPALAGNAGGSLDPGVAGARILMIR